MEGFNALIKTNGRIFRLEFTPVQTPAGEKYFISFENRDGKRTGFEMRKESPRIWVFLPPVPEQFNELENQLSQLIEQNV